MKGKDYLAFLNLAGAVSSILALLLTLSQNVTFAIIIKSLVAILFFIATVGTLGGVAYSFSKKIVKSDYWPCHLSYWLFWGMIIVIIAFFVALFAYMISSWFVYLFNSAIDEIKNGDL